MSSVELQAAIATELDENPALEMTELPTCPICGASIAGSYCTECMPNRGPEAADGVGTVTDDVPVDGPGPTSRRRRRVRPGRASGGRLHAPGSPDLEPPCAPSDRAFTRWPTTSSARSTTNGFVTQTDAEIAAATGVSEDEVTQVLAAMRGLEPIGIGSRSIAESLLAQVEYLRERGTVDVPPHTEAVVADHLAGARRPEVPRGRGGRGRHPARGHRRLGVREGEPQPVPDGSVHRRGDRLRRANDRPTGRHHPGRGRRARRRGRRVAPLQPPGGPDLLAAVRAPAGQRRDRRREGARSPLRRAEPASSSTTSTAVARRSSASPRPSSTSSATTWRTASSTSSRSRGRRWVPASGCTNRR